MKIEGCYASTTNKCSGVLTREHILSKSTLGGAMSATINGQTLSFNKNNFVISNLCTYHNNSFSNCESHIKYFLQFLADDAALFSRINSSTDLKSLNLPRKFMIIGKYLENWLLKSAINYNYFMNEPEKPKLDFDYVNKRLFEKESFSPPYGLHMMFPQKQLTHLHPGEIFFDFDYDNNGNIYSIIINLQGHLFLLLLPTKDIDRVLESGIFYNQEHFTFNDSINWHPGGVNQKMYAGDHSVVTRSLLKFKW